TAGLHPPAATPQGLAACLYRRQGYRRPPYRHFPIPPSCFVTPVRGVVAVPEGQLLVAVGRGIDGIQVRGRARRRGVEGGDELVEEDGPQALEGLDVDGVLEARQGGLAGQVVAVGGAVGEQLEDGVGAQGVVVVLVFVVGEDAVDAAADHLQEGV